MFDCQIDLWLFDQVEILKHSSQVGKKEADSFPGVNQADVQAETYSD